MMYFRLNVVKYSKVEKQGYFFSKKVMSLYSRIYSFIKFTLNYWLKKKKFNFSVVQKIIFLRNIKLYEVPCYLSSKMKILKSLKNKR